MGEGKKLQGEVSRLRGTSLFLLGLATAVLSFGARAEKPVPTPRASSLKRIAGSEGALAVPNPDEELKKIKVAIFDAGFKGYERGTKLLPRSTRDRSRDFAEKTKNPALGPDDSSPHGFWMAQLAWNMSGKSPDGPQIHLMSSSNLESLRYYVDIVIREKFDVVIMSNNFETSGNGDGQGPINSEVRRATDAGILWINSAGNFGETVYFAKVRPDRTGFLRLPDGYDQPNGDRQNLLNFKVKPLEGAKTGEKPVVTATLTWSDFGNSERDCTKKDLDLILIDSSGIRIRESRLIQDGSVDPLKANQDASKFCYPFESITMPLEAGDYSLMVTDQSGNFATDDSFRISIVGQTAKSGSGNYIEVPSHSDGHEIYSPADMEEVITVGAKGRFSSVGPTLDGRSKPDVVIDDSSIEFKGIGQAVDGSSNSAALLGGLIIRQIAFERKMAGDSTLRLDSDDLRRYFEKLQPEENGKDEDRRQKYPVWITPAPGVSIIDR